MRFCLSLSLSVSHKLPGPEVDDKGDWNEIASREIIVHGVKFAKCP